MIGLLNELSPITFGAKPVEGSKQAAAVAARVDESVSSQKSSFEDTLAQAKNDVLSEVGVLAGGQEMGILKDMLAVGLGTAMGNPLMTASSSMDMLEKMVGFESNKQLTTLGNLIGTQFISALSGDTSATSLLSNVSSNLAISAAQTIPGAVSDGLDLGVKEATKGLSDTHLDKLEFRKKTLPWQVEGQRLQDVLAERERQKNAKS